MEENGGEGLGWPMRRALRSRLSVAMTFDGEVRIWRGSDAGVLLSLQEVQELMEVLAEFVVDAQRRCG